jgi:23S rRNA (uracil1939-C5)-methyltransferase
MRAGDIKSVLFRCSQEGAVAAALFLKKKIDCSDFVLPESMQGLDIYYSSPKSPASIPTQQLESFGSTVLEDRIGGHTIRYSVLSFFQVNIPVFTKALEDIQRHTKDLPVIDMYSGVGTIGVCLETTDTLVESAQENSELARQNALAKNIKVVHAASENALEYIDSDHCLVVDPPRAGLHQSLIDKLLEVKPPKIVYLSCNPCTQVRDVVQLIDSYKITEAKGYNFFPRTPHIESLVVLEKK